MSGSPYDSRTDTHGSCQLHHSTPVATQLRQPLGFPAQLLGASLAWAHTHQPHPRAELGSVTYFRRWFSGSFMSFCILKQPHELKRAVGARHTPTGPSSTPTQCLVLQGLSDLSRRSPDPVWGHRKDPDLGGSALT